MGRLSDPAASRAVLVGTHTYGHLHDIPAVKRNVTRLTKLLRDPTLWGLERDHCRALLQPTRDKVLDAVHEAATDASDTLVLYFAGHGLTDPYTGELYLALPGSEPDRLDKALRYEDVRRLLLAARTAGAGGPRRKVVVLDCCWSGLALGGTMADGIGTRADIEGTFVLTATAETRQALAPPGETYTTFTGELIETVERGIEGGSETLTMAGLYDHLAASLGAKSLPVPQQRNRNTASHIAVFRNRAFRPPEPVPEGAMSGEAVSASQRAGTAGAGTAGPEGGVDAAAYGWRRRLVGTHRRTLVTALAALLPLTALTTAYAVNWWLRPESSDCGSGPLTLTGSSAFAPVLREAAASYESVCEEVEVRVDLSSGARALEALQKDGAARSSGTPGRSEVIAFAEGYKKDYPELLPSPIAFSVLTFYAHEKAVGSKVQGLSTEQINRIYRGEIKNWNELGGADVPIRLVNRPAASSSGDILRRQLLRADPYPVNSLDCLGLSGTEGTPPVTCEVATTAEALETVAEAEGALGYGPVQAVSGRTGVRMLSIDGRRPTREASDYGGYDFWATTYAYTYRRPSPGSAADGFLQYLMSRQRAEVIERYDFNSCARYNGAMPCRFS
ncbi:substrate-binding domain-containing protein [Streptomyces sp. NA04227]|uniref:caspase, EACC1-associated type n=1 Tax=Streptomyces sp. NA04227 TaxID=2742136 RepID=UPI00159095C6|nr:substrate-binding domain-containing protein [Streptomyces sp. NA04227]QKW09374.1 substrate-binding domain-containing protein [Streptomyces sp. NA04227]